MIFIICIVILILQFLFAREFNDIAYDKGYDSIKYFWYCFLFGIPVYLPVIALPDTIADTKAYTSNK